MKILGRVVDEKSIRMDPDKVDCIRNWKTPSIRGPMGILHALTGSASQFRWSFTEQRAFGLFARP
ncbi:hypothetical protein ARMSODRAFT_958437 [Armillaria solidipes]|uniref:Uncharacterized protein n=1 Tax=Armillaria solidipes TaxID=1076256 RepID=A0A2H3BMX2_9AGAR|nr:hypothetical protein ARMSODRAFT_958437 [Armillaria solidipes]